MTSIKSDNFEVGYRRPPKANRFRKGQSGNPRGRKRGSENFLAIFKRRAMMRVKLTMADGASKTLSVAEAVIAKNYQAALKGDETAMANILKLVELAGELQDRTDPKAVGRPLFMPAPFASLEEFLAETGSSVVKFGGYQTDD